MKVAPPNVEPTAPKKDETPEQIADRLKLTDEEVMRHFRKGEKAEGERKLRAAVKPYANKPPAECDKTEAFFVAVMRTRLLSFDADNMLDRELQAYVDVSRGYALRYGLTETLWKDASLKVSRETVAAMK